MPCSLHDEVGRDCEMEGGEGSEGMGGGDNMEEASMEWRGCGWL